MSYKVIHYFTDLQDFNHPYKVGDIFPRLGLKVSEERLKELSSNKNKQKKPLIQLVKNIEPVKEIKEETVYTKTDINRMSTQDLRILAVAQGLENVEESTGAELKKLLIDNLGL